MNLVTEEEFYTNAPENVTEPEKTRDDDHARYLARLKWELLQRKQWVSGIFCDHLNIVGCWDR